LPYTFISEQKPQARKCFSYVKYLGAFNLTKNFTSFSKKFPSVFLYGTLPFLDVSIVHYRKKVFASGEVPPSDTDSETEDERAPLLARNRWVILYILMSFSQLNTRTVVYVLCLISCNFLWRRALKYRGCS
jgi:hypothetical protein